MFLVDTVHYINDFTFQQEDEINELLGLAIRHKKVSFIRNILERHANIKSFLTVDVFEEMLRQIPRNLLLYNLLLKKCDDPKLWRFEHFAEVRRILRYDCIDLLFFLNGRRQRHLCQFFPIPQEF